MNLENILTTDPTLDALNQTIEQTNKEKIRKPPAMGASTVGQLCERKTWLQWRIAKTETFTAEQLRRFEDGYRAEDVEASRLSRVTGITLRTIDPVTGFQFSVEAISGHLKGRVDGRVMGLLQAPETEHVWECKCTNDKKQALLIKAKAEHGEKDALKNWDVQYYAQAILYMHLLGIDRHYLTCTTPGARWTVGVRTDANPIYAQGLLDKAERIKNAQQMPVALSENPSWYQCKGCTFYSLCHENKVADANCRTCLHSTAVENGEWNCAKFKSNVPSNFQDKGCDKHLFIPSLIPFAKSVDADEQENWVEYETPEGVKFKNGETYYSSKEISAIEDYKALGDDNINALKTAFDATVIA